MSATTAANSTLPAAHVEDSIYCLRRKYYHACKQMAAAAAFPVTTLAAGTQLYRQSFDAPTRTSTGSREDDGIWSFFALGPSYGTDATYGSIHSAWRLQKPLRLLNISTKATRTALSKRYNIEPEMLDCDFQYS